MTKYMIELAIVLVLALFFGCGGDGDGEDAGDGSGINIPAFLQTAFIEPTSNFTATTYDFTQAQAAGRQTVEIQNWQQIGSLGWQSNQVFTADFVVDDEGVTLSSQSPSGFSDDWTFIQIAQEGIQIQDARGQTRILFNCTSPNWPTLIRARACN